MIADQHHPLYGVSLKINRAGDQLKRLKIEIEDFFNTKPYVIERQVDPHAEHVLAVVRIKQPCPPMWSAVIGEIVHNLRCALDYLVFQLIILETGTAPTSSKVQFPIFETEAGFNSRGVPKMLHGVGSGAIARTTKSPLASQ